MHPWVVLKNNSYPIVVTPLGRQKKNVELWAFTTVTCPQHYSAQLSKTNPCGYKWLWNSSFIDVICKCAILWYCVPSMCNKLRLLKIVVTYFLNLQILIDFISSLEKYKQGAFQISSQKE